jgi:preprotein translocase subunit SecD
MAAPGGQQRPRTRLAVGIVAAALAVIVGLGSASVVLLAGDDDSTDAAADRSDDIGNADPGPEPNDPSESQDIGPPATIELRRVLQALPASADCSAADVWCTRSRTEAYRLGPAELRTADFVDAEARVSDYGQWVVGITLSEDGASRFEAVTRELAGNAGPTAQLAIVVDDLVVSAPAVQAPVPGGEIDISADFTQAEAERLAAAIEP